MRSNEDADQVGQATTTPTASGEPLITEVTQEDVAAALDGAGWVGDDVIQRELGGGTDLG